MASGDILGAVASQTTLEDVQSKAAEILETLGNSSGGGTEDTVIEMLQELLTQPKVIKHIQRGIVAGDAFVYGELYTATIELSEFSNIDKMVVLIEGLMEGNSADDWIEPFVNSFTEINLVLATKRKVYTTKDYIYYKVVELY